ncbi:hypothetical protein E8E13_002794 [Curvularia kusanoi]|uniref:Uncharacterized protein n=1 Tax=Curvularia kusanoi TaxID=90978 RepID=A0A9P4TCA9_CURKU|nr:hypothetical protein E8E13_002794 [Curvularia kusanoi]
MDEGWLPLTFDHDKKDYSSFLTNAKFAPALHCYRKDQKWMKMLLPDIYHGRWEVPQPYGGLKGELAIFLALVAFSMPVDNLKQYLPSMFRSGTWQQYEMANGRDHKRGVVVEVRVSPSSRHSSKEDLESFEEHGMYYV